MLKKHLKKFICITLTATMLAGVSVTTFAEETSSLSSSRETESKLA